MNRNIFDINKVNQNKINGLLDYMRNTEHLYIQLESFSIEYIEIEKVKREKIKNISLITAFNHFLINTLRTYHSEIGEKIELNASEINYLYNVIYFEIVEMAKQKMEFWKGHIIQE